MTAARKVEEVEAIPERTVVVQTVKACGLELETEPGVAAPKDQTALVKKALELVQGAEPLFIVVRSGAGEIACALAKALPTAKGWASDASEAAVKLTRRNLVRHDAAARVLVNQGELFDGFDGLPPVDLVVSDADGLNDAAMPFLKPGGWLVSPAGTVQKKQTA